MGRSRALIQALMLCTLCVLQAACGSQGGISLQATGGTADEDGSVPIAAAQVSAGPYRLAAGDVVAIAVLGQADLSGIQEVAQSGTVALPLIGQIRAGGLTTAELTDAISDALADGFLVNPQVAVRVDEYRPIFVTGAVVNGGAFPYQPGLTVLKALALAGGPEPPTATRVAVSVSRPLGPVSETIEGPELTSPILPGDTVVVRTQSAVSPP